MPSELILAALGSCAVGLFIGWCGVAGFLLPILFVNSSYFTVGFKRLFQLAPNMDSLVALGAAAGQALGGLF